MELDCDSLSALAADIFTSMLGFELEPGNGAMGMLGKSATMTACVQIAGDWPGAVTVSCPTQLAKEFAGAMFGCDGNDLDLEDVMDALGELTNMTGGSVKGLVPGDNELGIPTVAEGERFSMTVPHASEVARLEFEYGGLPLAILVFKVAA